VLITGGASGIGKIMTRICLEKKAKEVIVWDINKGNLSSMEAELGALGKVEGQVVDVSDSEQISLAWKQLKERAGKIDILINCAGIVRGNNTFDRQSIRDIDLTMQINANAPMYVALNVLPDMVERDHGFICNIASAAGMLGVPKLSVYCASKWAVIGWTESMRVELKLMKSHVKVMSVAPYFINTGMFDGVCSKVFPILDPEKTAKKIIRAMERGRSFRGIPFPYHFIRFWQGILPNALFDFIFGKCFGIYSVMDHFTGRKPTDATPQQ